MSATQGSHRQTMARAGAQGTGQQTAADHQQSRAKDGAVAGQHIETASRRDMLPAVLGVVCVGSKCMAPVQLHHC